MNRSPVVGQKNVSKDRSLPSRMRTHDPLRMVSHIVMKVCSSAISGESDTMVGGQPYQAVMKHSEKIGGVEVTFMHIRLAKNCIEADIAMRQRTRGTIPCTFFGHGGTIAYHYSLATDIITGACDSGNCVRFR